MNDKSIKAVSTVFCYSDIKTSLFDKNNFIPCKRAREARWKPVNYPD